MWTCETNDIVANSVSLRDPPMPALRDLTLTLLASYLLVGTSLAVHGSAADGGDHSPADQPFEQLEEESKVEFAEVEGPCSSLSHERLVLPKRWVRPRPSADRALISEPVTHGPDSSRGPPATC